MALPRIPVVPIGYRNAMHLLPALGGPSVPQTWQGALPFRYHVGGDTTTVMRIAVWPESEDRDYKTIVNTIATLRGTDRPEEIVLAGAHRDAWGRGAADNASGIATLLESARVLGAAARAGQSPKRTLVLATWDAGEWGHIGVTEYMEQFGNRLRGRVVVYLNHDTSVSGRILSVSADSGHGQLFREVAEVVPGLREGESVLDEWRLRAGSHPTPGPVDSSEYCGDCTAIRRALEVPALEFGFREPNGLLHSAYDSPLFGSLADPDFRAHAAAARLSATLLARLGSDPDRTVGSSARAGTDLQQRAP